MASAIVAAIGLTGTTAVIVGAIISVGLSYAVNAIFGRDQRDNPANQPQGPQSILVNKRSNTANIPVVYGERRIGGNRIFIAPSGDGNRYLDVVLCISEGEVEGFRSIQINDEELFFPPSAFDLAGNLIEGTEHAATDGGDETSDRYANKVWITTYHGSDTQAADANLVNRQANWSDNHRLRGKSYIYARFDFDREVFSGLPNITTVMRGRRLYDPRNDTTSYSNNPALVMRDYLTNSRYGRGIETITVDDDDIEEAANYCELELVLMDADGNESYRGDRYHFNNVLETSESLYDNTQTILQSMRGFLVFSGGFYKLILDKPEMSSVLYDESNIIGAIQANLGNKKNTLNYVRATYVNPDKEWDGDSVILDNETARANLDDGLILSRDIQLNMVTTPHIARYIANQELEQSRQQTVITFTVGIAGMQNEIGDLIRVRHLQFGWGAQTLEVDGEFITFYNDQNVIDHIGATGLFQNWVSGTDYEINTIVQHDGQLFQLRDLTGIDTSVDPDMAPANWTLLDTFNDLLNVDAYPDGQGANMGTNGQALYKEFRILSMSLKEQEEVEITAIEYNAAVYDNLPTSFEDATPSNRSLVPIGPPHCLSFRDFIHTTNVASGAQRAVRLEWVAPDTPSVDSYEVFIAYPDEAYSASTDYILGDTVTFRNRTFGALVENGPSSVVVPPIMNDGTISVDSWQEVTEVGDDSFDLVTRTADTFHQELNITPGVHQVRIRSVSVFGTRSEFLEGRDLYFGSNTIRPADLTGLGASIQGGLLLLQWPATADLDVRSAGSVQVRFNPSTTQPVDTAAREALWQSGATVLLAEPGMSTQALVPLRAGTYLVKSIGSGGEESANSVSWLQTAVPTSARTEIADSPFNEHTDWLGLIADQDVDADSAGLEIHLRAADSVPVLRFNTGGQTEEDARPTVAVGTYYASSLVSFPTLTEAVLSANVVFTPRAVSGMWDGLGMIDDLESITGVPNSTVVVEVSTTSDDPTDTSAVWTPYTSLLTGTFFLRGARFRMRVSGPDVNTQVDIEQLSFTVET